MLQLLPRPSLRRRLGAGLTLLLAAIAPPAGAQQDKIEQVERRLAGDRAAAAALEAEAAALAAEVEALRAQSIEVARRAQDLESAMTEAERQLEALGADEAAKSAALAERRGQLARTLGALQRLALQPPEAALARSASPVDSARAGLLLQVAIPELEQDAAGLRAALGDLAVLRARMARKRDDLAAATAALSSERNRLDALVARKRALQAATEAEREAAAARIARLAAQARDLRQLTERLEAERQEAERLAAQQRALEAARQAAAAQAAQEPPKAAQAAPAAPPSPVEQGVEQEVEQGVEPAPRQVARLTPPPSLRPFPEAGASLAMPVRGKVVRLFGQESANAGSTERGISIATRPGAQVVAPFDGKIAYAGPFRGYGLILIIEHGGRYHTILAGFDRIDAVVGQWVLAGEPIARMGEASGATPELYFELRRTGQAINPLPWLATTDDKVRG